MNERYDAIVVGARCAGAATAMLLARSGLRVLVVDQEQPGRDTLSTHALLRGGVLQLSRWGLLDRLRAAVTPPLRGSTFHYRTPEGPVDETIDVRRGHGVDALYAPRRTVLDPLLVAAAREAGADVRYGVRVDGLLRDGTGRVTGITAAVRGGGRLEATAPITVGADGVRSVVARAVAAPVTRHGSEWAAIAYRYAEGLPAERFDWYYARGAAAGVIPTNSGLACVWGSLPAQRFRAELQPDLGRGLDAVLAAVAPDLAERVRAAEPAGPVRGTPGRAGFLRVPAGAGWALVGDASHYKDPITAHGITDALRDAELLANAIVATRAGDTHALRAYHRTRDTLSGELFAVTDRIASFAWDTDELRELLRLLSRAQRPEIDALLALDGPGADAAA